MPVGAYETLSHRIGPRRRRCEQSRGEAQQARLVAPDENPERLAIAAQDPGDYLDVR